LSGVNAPSPVCGMIAQRIAKGYGMKFSTFTQATMAAALVALPLQLSAQSSAQISAQTPPAPSEAENEIVVEAPRNLPPPRKKKRTTHSGAPSVVATVRMMVLYGDLDLTKHEDAARLTIRIERTARDACNYLDQMYPLVRDAECIKRAVTGASETAKTVIAAKQAAKPAAN
jgi:UrcA family protein